MRKEKTEVVYTRFQKGDKVFLNFSRNSVPEYEVYEVMDYGSLCRLKHIASGAVQGVVSTDKLILAEKRGEKW